MNPDLAEKNYYEQLMVGHYLDVKYSEQEWKIARITEKDKRYAVVVYEGINYRDEVSPSTRSKSICKATRPPL
jgi:tRNA U34 2-thiouridine synthase MnmA/TrmU